MVIEPPQYAFHCRLHNIDPCPQHLLLFPWDTVCTLPTTQCSCVKWLQSEEKGRLSTRHGEREGECVR